MFHGQRKRWFNRKKSLLYALHPAQLPAESIRWRYTWGLGGITIFAALITVLTGLLLMFYYVPEPGRAYSSVETIQDLAYGGALLRGLHFWAAQVMVIGAVLHMARIVFTAAYRRPRRLNWLIGLSLLILTLLWDFSGYVLRWDEETFWALSVGTNLVKTIPLMGKTLYLLLVGDWQIGPAALLRFYTWHVMGLTLLVVFGIVYHLWRVRVDGGISRPPLAAGKRRRFLPKEALFWRESVAALALMALFLGLAIYFPPALGQPASVTTDLPEVKAPWIFLGIQELLRYGNPFLWGIVVPLAVLAFWALLPFVDRQRAGSSVWFAHEHRPCQIAYLLTLLAMLFFTVRAALR